MGPLAHIGIALATSASAWVNGGLLAYGLYRRGRLRPDTAFRRKLPRIVLASVVIAGAVGAVTGAAAPYLAGSEPVRIATLGAIVLGGVLLYAVLAQISGAMSVTELRAALTERHPSQQEGDVPAAGGGAPLP